MVIESYFIDWRAGQGQLPHFCHVLKMFVPYLFLISQTLIFFLCYLLNFKKITCLGTNAAFDEENERHYEFI